MCYIAEKKEYFSYLSSIKKSIFEEIMNRKGEILNDIDNSNYSIIKWSYIVYDAYIRRKFT